MSQSWTSSTRFLSLFFVRKRVKISELKLNVQPQWLVKWKNVNNTIHWPYTNAEFKKKKKIEFLKISTRNQEKPNFTSGLKKGAAPTSTPTIFWSVQQNDPMINISKGFRQVQLCTRVIPFFVLLTPNYCL